MNSEGQVFFNRVRARLSRAESLKNISKWVEQNTSLSGRPFSFKDHEFQVEIVNDTSRDLVIKKCSQVGLSEITVRKILGRLNILNNTRAILVLPTARFASKFAKDRIDPVIEQSETLSSCIIAAADSSEMKRMGGSTLYINGSVGQTAAISVPAEIVEIDEYDFCDQERVSNYASRLRHAEGGGYFGKFSTPTVSEYGISKEFLLSSQKHYTVRCVKCNHEQVPDLERDLVIPGYEGELKNFEKEDLIHPAHRIDEARLLCQSCRADLWPALIDPSRRRWVAKYPNRAKVGYQVSPFDLPKYNTVPGVLAQRANYALKGDFYNFVLGLEYTSKENQILDAVVEQNTVLNPMGPNSGVSDVTLGIDVGKTCHYKVYARDQDGELHVIWVGTLRLAEAELKSQIVGLIEKYNPRRVLIDAMPDFSTVQSLIDDYPGLVYAVYSVEQPKKRQLGYFEVDDEKSTVTINRTRAFDEYASFVNEGRIKFPRMDEMTIVRQHFKQMRRVTQFNEDGERTNKWVKLSEEDHYMHAGLFGFIADQIDFSEFGYAPNISPFGMAGVDVGRARKKAERAEAQKARYGAFWRRQA